MPGNKFRSSEITAYVFPNSQQIMIQKSDLQIQLAKFKDRVLAVISYDDIAVGVTLILPLLTSEFKGVYNIPSDGIKYAYAAIAGLLILYKLFTKIISLWSTRKVASANPEKMAEKMLEICFEKSI